MQRRVVVTGMGTVNPIGATVAESWNSVVTGRSGVARIASFDPTEFKTQIAAEVRDFDAVGRFGRKVARQTDRVIQFALAATEEALAHANLTIDESNRDDIGVVLGSGIGGIGSTIESHDVLNAKGARRINPYFIPKMLPDSAPGVVSIKYGMRGPNMNIATACASANNAIGEAAKMIERGSAEMMVTGGTEASINPLIVGGFSVMGALSTRNDDPTASRPFDATRDGFVAGEGAAILVLESLDHAQKRGAPILAELKGYGTAADAFHISAPHEQGEGAIRSMQLALTDAGLTTEDIDYINAHGTSTPLNDRMETFAVKQLFRERAYSIPMSSTKALHGHLLGATAALEAVISIEALRHGQLPPTWHYTTPDDACDLDYVTDGPRPATINTVLSNAFGFGGHNATLVFGNIASGG